LEETLPIPIHRPGYLAIPIGGLQDVINLFNLENYDLPFAVGGYYDADINIYKYNSRRGKCTTI